mgnify:CR=1 FL=1
MPRVRPVDRKRAEAPKVRTGCITCKSVCAHTTRERHCNETLTASRSLCALRLSKHSVKPP